MFHHACWIGWIVGAVLIMLSRWDLVSNELGWAGFYVASATAVISYFPRFARRQRSDDWAVLTKSMLDSKDHGYDTAIARLQQGGTVFFDGLAFAARPCDELALATVASLPASLMDERRALQDAERAQATFEAIARSSPEIAALASDKQIRVSLLSEYGANGVEICRITSGEVEWKGKR